MLSLFERVVPDAVLHPVVPRLMTPELSAERELLLRWADGFVDRDGKFVKEFQTTFESSLWELYLHAALREYGVTLDTRHHAPDFVVTAPVALSIEATVARPAAGDADVSGPGAPPIPKDLNAFNHAAMLRLCNAFDAKVRRYRAAYRHEPHVADRPFVIALAPFDRPVAQLAAHRPIVAALYGHYVDEEATIANGLDTVVQYPVDAVRKSETANVPLGLFCSDAFSEVSALIFSTSAGMGKLRALADNPDASVIFQTLHPPLHGLMPVVRAAVKREYSEHLLDGLYILHNPFAAHPLNAALLDHPRVLQAVWRDGAVVFDGPDDFLLMRNVWSLTSRTNN